MSRPVGGEWPRPNMRLKLPGALVLEEAIVSCPGGHGLSSNGDAPACESPAAFCEAAYPVKPGTEPGFVFGPSSSRARSRCRSAFCTRSSVTSDRLVGAVGDPGAVALTKRRPHPRP